MRDMPNTLNARLPLKDIVFSDVILLPDEWNAFVGWREKGAIRMSYGHGGATAEEAIIRLEKDLVKR